MYRVDRRKFNLKEVILPSPNSYQEKGRLHANGVIIEEALESTRPESKLYKRKDGLFVFRDLCDAVAFHQVMRDSNIYKVESTPDTLLFHRGDMNFTELMNHMISDKISLESLAKLYWQSKKTFKPCWEMLFNEVKVKAILDTAGLKSEYNNSSGQFEAMPSYRRLLNSRFA